MTGPSDPPKFTPYHEDNYGPWISNAGNTLHTAPNVPDAHPHDVVMVHLRDGDANQNYLGWFVWDDTGHQSDDILGFRFLATHPHYKQAAQTPIDTAALADHPLYGLFA
ncbi:hypothetical protein ACQKOE_07225 [Novosphingobium sp. NPDC080210]|uniref:hypothetical protein n=1 Tax=Novosphingobium sp. NPDC080210 TaxID=3390596 RepID=UPI003D00FF7A